LDDEDEYGAFGTMTMDWPGIEPRSPWWDFGT